MLTSFLLNGTRGALQPELDAFFDHALGRAADRHVTKSALCQARRDLAPTAVRKLLAHSAHSMHAHVAAPTWQGRRVLALDSTILRVPNTPECGEHFGVMATACGKLRPLARASALLDVARGCFVDAVLGGYADDDRRLAQQHLDALGPDDLLVMDRGYPSRTWLGELATRGIAFCARICGHRWREVRKFDQSGQTDQIVDLGTPTAPLKVRLLRFVLPNATVLLLATNLFDAELDPGQFAALYRQRWRIEEAFKLIKARLQVENWSGLLPHTTLQDFYASLVRANCGAALLLDTQPPGEALDSHDTVRPNGWRKKANVSYALACLRQRLPNWLLGLHLDTIVTVLVRLGASVAKVMTRPDRTAPRHKGVRLHGFHPAYKPA